MNISKNLKNQIFSKKTIIPILVTIFVFILDRVTKTAIINHQINNKSIFLNEYLNFDLVWNTGIGFGLLSQNANLYYHLITLLIFLVIIYLISMISRVIFSDKILFSLILGGALGNFYDRLFYFAVPDFIDIHINNFHWFVFNIADIFITIGVIILVVKDVILNKK